MYDGEARLGIVGAQLASLRLLLHERLGGPACEYNDDVLALLEHRCWRQRKSERLGLARLQL